jgi:hypothetical protein
MTIVICLQIPDVSVDSKVNIKKQCRMVCTRFISTQGS